jgi:hypothetical protein
MTSGTGNLDSILAGANSMGAATLDLINAGDMGNAIQNGLGITPDDIQASSATLIAVLADDSGSIGSIRGGEQMIADGFNAYMDALKGSKDEDGIAVGTWLVSNPDMPLQPFVAISNVTRLDVGRNYRAHSGTPLYRTVCNILATLATKAQAEFYDAGVPCKCILLIITDGDDQDRGSQFTAARCATLIRDMGEGLIVQFMGIDDGRTDFRQIARDMGINDNQVVVPGFNAHDIRQAFAMASRSAKVASQNAGAGFTAASQSGLAGGFVNLVD